MDSTNDGEVELTVEEALSHLGISPTNSTRNTFLGKRRACYRLNRLEWLFLGIVSFTLAIVLSLTLYRFSYLPKTSNEFTLAILVLFNIGFCYIYAYHGVLYEEPNEICCLVLSTGIILVYSVLGFELGHFNGLVKTVKFSITCFFGLFIVILACAIGCNYRKSRDLVFRIVGADASIQTACRQVQRHFVLLLFDTQAIFSCIILIINAVGSSVVEEWVVLIVASIFTIIWMVIGYVSVRCENQKSMIVFWMLCTVPLGYFFWCLVNAFKHQSNHLGLAIICTSGVAFLFIHIFLIVNTVWTYKNFGKGLRERIFNNGQQTSQYGSLSWNEQQT